MVIGGGFIVVVEFAVFDVGFVVAGVGMFADVGVDVVDVVANVEYH